MRLITARDASVRLGVSLRTLDHLWRADLLAEPETIGKQKLYLAEEVEALSSRPIVREPFPRAYVVRVLSSSAVDEPDRKFAGFTAGDYCGKLTPAENEAARRDAVRGWWPVRDPEDFLGVPLVATLGGYVVAVYHIDAVENPRNGRRRFVISAPRKSEREAFEGKRLPLGSGPVSMGIGTKVD